MLKLKDLKQGHNTPGDNGSDPTDPPPWLNREKFNGGRKFFHDHFTSVLLGMYTSLACGLSVRNLLDPLVFTERSNTPKKAFQRYLSTFKHVVLWHLGDVWEPTDNAFASVQSVRRMHGEVASAMRRSNRGTAIVVSQYDMAIVQCGFMGAIILYPSACGVKCTVKELEDYIHFWRGLGYLLGMDDQFNICGGDYAQTVEICTEIERKIVGEGLKSPPIEFERMARAFVDGSNIPLPFRLFTYESVLVWVIENSNTFKDERALYANVCKPSFCDLIRVKVYMLFCCVLRTFPSIESKLNNWFIGNWCKYLKMNNPVF